MGYDACMWLSELKLSLLRWELRAEPQALKKTVTVDVANKKVATGDAWRKMGKCEPDVLENWRKRRGNAGHNHANSCGSKDRSNNAVFICCLLFH
jgi:hypothetical protein